MSQTLVVAKNRVLRGLDQEEKSQVKVKNSNFY